MSNDPMRPRDEIQRAHDILTQMLLDPGLVRQLGFSEGDLGVIISNVDALCWVLRHDHNSRFSNFLTAFEQDLARLGLGVSRYSEMQYPNGRPQ